ncbi:36053_t:CDS:2 [Gigaspora margarita]|uniref:36053_t:CDS:1 n=1 Tax=Gigaspora margarita TaxID=4874 RepID=A0ABN7UUF7_GIGMA|nr:36053_t:CDS:2 [Gigaspora margarita]
MSPSDTSIFKFVIVDNKFKVNKANSYVNSKNGPFCAINSNFDINSSADVNGSKTTDNIQLNFLIISPSSIRPDNIEYFKHVRHFDPIFIVTIGQTENNTSNFISVPSMSFEQPSTTEYSKVENLFLKLKAQNVYADVEIDDSCEGHENETNEPFEWSDNFNSGLVVTFQMEENPGEGGGVELSVKIKIKLLTLLLTSGRQIEPPSRYKTEQILELKLHSDFTQPKRHIHYDPIVPNMLNNTINYSKSRDKDNSFQIELNEWDVDIDYCETNGIQWSYRFTDDVLDIGIGNVFRMVNPIMDLISEARGLCITIMQCSAWT